LEFLRMGDRGKKLFANGLFLLLRKFGAIDRSLAEMLYRHPGGSRGPVPDFAGLKNLDSGVRRNDGGILHIADAGWLPARMSHIAAVRS
jgi:hypothetical protein